MTWGRKTGGRDFVPDDPRRGRPHVPPEIRVILKARRNDILQDLILISKLPPQQLEKIMNDPKSTSIQAAIAAVLRKAIDTGDSKSLDCILNRMIGRSKEKR